ncbi:MAG TPA: transporter associated domain-containing protein, partial [Ardenticatenaceae bacterium]|nr:transporter associated domain-containing protein [Ardenticatenaceae bacterium]
DLDLPHNEVHTIGGLALALLGRQPKVGEEVAVGETRLRVEAVSGAAVREVTLIPPQGSALSLPAEFDEDEWPSS